MLQVLWSVCVCVCVCANVPLEYTVPWPSKTPTALAAHHNTQIIAHMQCATEQRRASHPHTQGWTSTHTINTTHAQQVQTDMPTSLPRTNNQQMNSNYTHMRLHLSLRACMTTYASVHSINQQP